MTAAYKVRHDTHYRYTTLVATSQHTACLKPRDLPFQRTRAHHLVIDPPPSSASQRVDYFGNVVDQFQIVRPHTELSVSARSVVEVHERDEPVNPAASVPWDRVETETPDVSQFRFSSPHVPIVPEMRSYAERSFPPGQTVLGGALDLTHRIHAEFSFDSSATNVSTPVTRVLADRRGVCQDFAHVQLSCLRSLGLAARYVSGYLMTDPPLGQARLIGADASHAWIAVHCPRHGWIDLDPTNDVIVGLRHVTVAWGRDYGDVSPLRGVLLGGADHSLQVSVSVVPGELEQEILEEQINDRS
jgi:transglutaminase-like putative cysteine protease